MSKKPPIIAFSTDTKTDASLKRLSRETGKNRSQIIRDLINGVSNMPMPTLKIAPPENLSLLQSQENLVKNFFDMLSSKPFVVVSYAIASRGDRVLIVYPKKPNSLFRYSTWEFPSVVSKSLDVSIEIAQKLSKDLGTKAKTSQLILGRLVPEESRTGSQVIALYWHCRISSGKIKLMPAIREAKWVPAAQVGRYFTTSLGDPLVRWLSLLK